MMNNLISKDINDIQLSIAEHKLLCKISKNSTAFCIVKGKNDKYRNGKIKEGIDNANVEFGKEFHTTILPSFSTLSESN